MAGTKALDRLASGSEDAAESSAASFDPMLGPSLLSPAAPAAALKSSQAAAAASRHTFQQQSTPQPSKLTLQRDDYDEPAEVLRRLTPSTDLTRGIGAQARAAALAEDSDISPGDFSAQNWSFSFEDDYGALVQPPAMAASKTPQKPSAALGKRCSC